MPTHGRYVPGPARTDAHGVAYLPPAPADKLPVQAAIIGASILAAGAAWLLTGGRRRIRKSKAYKSPKPEPLQRRGVGS